MARYAVIFHPGDTTPDRLKIVDDATTAPDADDDAATLGVTVGSFWLDTAAGKVYMAQSVATGAAAWIDLTAGGNHPDLSTHDVLGLATDADLSAHAADPDAHHTDHAHRWVPLMDGNGNVLTDGGTGAAIMTLIS